MKINLLIPCYNEGESIEILYEKIKQFNENHKLDINFFIWTMVLQMILLKN